MVTTQTVLVSVEPQRQGSQGCSTAYGFLRATFKSAASPTSKMTAVSAIKAIGSAASIFARIF
jgi:hypothetical protein